MSDVTEIDLTTNPPTITHRCFTPAELAQRELDAAYAAAEEEARQAYLAEREAARVALLARLGITEEEAALLFGSIT